MIRMRRGQRKTKAAAGVQTRRRLRLIRCPGGVSPRPVKKKLAVARQLALSLMWLFARWIEDALNMAVQRSHDADARERRRAAARRHEDQSLHCRLPLRRRVLGFRKLGDVVARILQGD